MANIPKSGIGIKIAKNIPIIPYFIIADECMIFYKATRSIARNVNTILKNYCNVFEQLVNYFKSMVQSQNKLRREKCLVL